MTEEQQAAEAAIRMDWEAEHFQEAATRALDAYGAQILSFLVARTRSLPEAQEVFSIFAEDFWKGLPKFGFRCSMQGWLYALARNAAHRYSTAPHRRAERNLALSQQTALGNLVEQLRSTTHAYQHTETKDAFRELREKLSEQDQTLLVLHVDKNLPWREIAIVLNDQDALPDDTALDREAARLRKRFERVKAELKANAIEQGLLKG